MNNPTNPDDAAMFAMIKRAGGDMNKFKRVRDYQAWQAGANGFTQSFNPKNIPGELMGAAGNIGKAMWKRATGR